MGDSTNKFAYATSEQLIKTYRYLSSSNKEQKSDEDRLLSVTTHRVILESISNNGFMREEYPVECIDHINSSFYHSKKGLFGLFFIILGVIIIGVSFIEALNELFAFLKFILIGVGAVLIIIGILYFIIKKSKQSFKLTLFSRSEFHPLTTISGENFHKKEKKQKKNSNQKKATKEVKIISKVTPAAKVMINELSALIIDLKTYKYQMQENYKLVTKGNITIDEYNTLQESAITKIKETYKEIQ